MNTLHLVALPALVALTGAGATAAPENSAVSFVVLARQDVAPRPLQVRVVEFVDSTGDDHSNLFVNGESASIPPGRYRYRLLGAGIAAKGYVTVRPPFEIVKVVVNRMPTVVGVGAPVAIDGSRETSKISGKVVGHGRSAPLVGRALVIARLLIDGSREHVARIAPDGTFELTDIDAGLMQITILDASGVRHNEIVSAPQRWSPILQMEVLLESPPLRTLRPREGK